MSDELERRTYHPPAVGDRMDSDVATGLGNPQWVILGLGKHDGRVGILASDQLDTATLEMVRPELYRSRSAFYDGPSIYDRPIYSAELKFKQYRDDGAHAFWIIYAPTYQQALAHLAALWSVR
jgi:hypothetical protein